LGAVLASTAEYRLEVVHAGRYITTCAAVAASNFNEVNEFVTAEGYAA
jgi:hypothetical protein